MSFSPQRFRGKYSIASNRLKEWDYGAPGYYFVTICTQNRIPWFGKIIVDRMVSSPAGEIAIQELLLTAHIRPNVSIEPWVVMPNHIHAIIVIDENPGAFVETPRRGVSAKINWKPGTLGAIINQYKSMCTKRIRAAGCGDFVWQARFYDHIIQNEKELVNIAAYILENPIKWTDDEYFMVFNT